MNFLIVEINHHLQNIRKGVGRKVRCNMIWRSQISYVKAPCSKNNGRLERQYNFEPKKVSFVTLSGPEQYHQFSLVSHLLEIVRFSTTQYIRLFTHHVTLKRDEVIGCKQTRILHRLSKKILKNWISVDRKNGIQFWEPEIWGAIKMKY